jgi:hypothetical protein
VVALPPAPFWKNQAAYEVAFGRLAHPAASMFAYFCGEFVNSFVLAKMKIPTAGRWLWTRTIGSTIVGEAVDSRSSTRSPSTAPASSRRQAAARDALAVRRQGRVESAVHAGHLRAVGG